MITLASDDNIASQMINFIPDDNNVIIWDIVIIWDAMLSSGANVIS
jgi:hypothetical protein